MRFLDHSPGQKEDTIITAKFTLGRLVGTPAALKAIVESGQSPADFLARHARGDWGDCCEEDGKLNDQALIDGSRILSVYHTRAGVKLYVITEASDDEGRRAATTILLPEEY